MSAATPRAEKPPKIWTSSAWRDTTFIKHLDYDNPLTPTPKDRVAVIDLLRAGELVPPELLPPFLFTLKGASPKPKLGNIFRITDSMVVLSEAFATVLSQVDLGRTRLHEVPVYRHDRKTPIAGRYFILNVAEHKDCFVLDQSRGPIDRVGDTDRFKVAPWGYEDLAVRASANAGVDLWMDPRLRYAVFFSDRLGRAIKAAKLGRTGLKPCVVVG